MTEITSTKKRCATFLFAFSCLMMMNIHSNAQTKTDSTELDEILEASDTLNQVENFIANATDSIPSDINISPETLYPDYSDAEYAQRLLSLESSINLTYNDQVKALIRLYVFRKREQVQRMLGLSQIYFPIFEEVMRNNNMPTELKYMAVIESALNPSAVSHCGATGLWQFMYGTAKLYGLKINKDIDERRDIYKSTNAAAAYLKGSYDKYGDWLLAIASYNCGPGNVDRAIYRSGGKTDFWEIMKYLPKETRGYVPAFMAAMYVMNYYPLHNLYPQYPDMKFCEISCFPVTDKICFDNIAKYTNYTVDDLKFLNPGLNSNVIPVWENDPYVLRIPTEMLPVYDAMKDSIVLSSKYVVPKYCYSSKYYGTGSSRVHIVRKGETLGSIAAKNHVSVTNLKKWNGLHNNLIHAGQKLKMYGGTSNTYVSNKTSGGGTTTNNSKVVYYKVRPGDSLWSIAKKYKGVTVDEIRANNSPSKTQNLKAGTTLKLIL